MYKYILFDLDGTLTDPEEGILNSVVYALNKFDIKVEDKFSLRPFIGPPLNESFTKYYGFDDEKAKLAVEYYREYFGEIGLFENKVFPGAAELLETLKSLNKTVMLATSKPEIYTFKILEKFDLIKYFDVIAGATLDYSRVKKADVIKYALSKIEGIDLNSTIMVGDREHDVIGAKANGIKAVGVTFGYGSREELESHGADYVVDDIKSLTDLLK